MASPTLVATYGQAVNSGGVLSVSVPSVVNGDWLVVGIFESYGTTVLAPGGSGGGSWTAVGSQVGSPNSPNYQNQSAAFFRKTCPTSGTYTVAPTTGNEAVVLIAHLRNCAAVDGTPSVAAVAQASSTGSVAMAATSPATADAMLLGFFALLNFSGTFTWTAPSGMTERQDLSNGTGVESAGLATQVLAASGSTGVKTAVSSVGSNTVYGQAYGLFAISGTTGTTVVKAGGANTSAGAPHGAKTTVHERPKAGGTAGRGAPGGPKVRQATNPKTGAGAAAVTGNGARSVITFTKRGAGAAAGAPRGVKVRVTFTKSGAGAAGGAPGGGERLQPSQYIASVQVGTVVQPLDIAHTYPVGAPPAVGVVVNPVTVAHMVTVSPVMVGVATPGGFSASTALSPASVAVVVQPVTVGFSGSRNPPSRRGLPPVVFHGGVRVMAQTILSGTWVHRELPLGQLKLTSRLSGPQLITGVVEPENRELSELMVALPPWGTWLHVEEGGDIRGSGIFLPPAVDEDGTMTITATGVSGYAARIPYVGDFRGVQVDPASIVRLLWDHIQSFPRGNLGVSVIGATPVLVGDAPAPPAASTTAGVVQVDPNPPGPYYIHGYEFPPIGRIIDQLGQDTPFDYVEEQAWADPSKKDYVTHTIRLGYPAIGRRLDLNVTQGENLFEHGPFEEPDDAYADSAYVKGSGEGLDSILGYGGVPIPDRLRMPTVVTDKTIMTKPLADSRAATEVAYRLAAVEELGQIAVNVRHPNSPWGSFACGDEWLPRVRLPYYGSFAQWHRITQIEYDPQLGVAAVTMTRQSSFRG